MRVGDSVPLLSCLPPVMLLSFGLHAFQASHASDSGPGPWIGELYGLRANDNSLLTGWAIGSKGAIVVGAEERAEEPFGDLAPTSPHELMRESLERAVHHDVAASCHAVGNLTPSWGLGGVAAQHDCAGNELRPCDRPCHAGPLPFWTALRFP